MDEFIGLAEISEILGISKQRVDQLIREHPEFPEPIASPKAGRIWRRSDIEEFKTIPRKAGRPPKEVAS